MYLWQLLFSIEPLQAIRKRQIRCSEVGFLLLQSSLMLFFEGLSRKFVVVVLRGQHRNERGRKLTATSPAKTSKARIYCTLLCLVRHDNEYREPDICKCPKYPGPHSQRQSRNIRIAHQIPTFYYVSEKRPWFCVICSTLEIYLPHSSSLEPRQHSRKRKGGKFGTRTLDWSAPSTTSTKFHYPS